MTELSLDFKDTEHYNIYKELINEILYWLIHSIMISKDNEVKYTWNDVLKQVYLIVKDHLKGLEDSQDMNPYEWREKIMKGRDLIDEEVREKLWIQSDMM